MTDAKTLDAKGFTGWHALACFLGFFGLMFVVNGAFLYQAITSFPGEDVPKSYLQGLNYNATLEARATQAETGWQAEMGAVGDEFVFRLKDSADYLVGGQVAEVAFQRPATTGSDTILTLRAVDAGEYTAPVIALAPGYWDAVVTVRDPVSQEVRFTARKSVYIK